MEILDILLEKQGTGLTTEEQTAVTAYALNQVRTRRDHLLSLTDKYTSSDFPLTDAQKTSILAYRQELRDITNTTPTLNWNSALVDNITWPTHEFVSEYDFMMAGVNEVPKD